jgi:hypothetical protein
MIAVQQGGEFALYTHFLERIITLTLKELSQLYHLNREIEMDQQRLEELKAKAENPSSGLLSHSPKGGSCENKIERYVAEIIDLTVIIDAKQRQCIHERNRLERYIGDIGDSLTRMIFTYRFINGLGWEQVAGCIGCGNDWKNLSNICYRYVKKSHQTKR